MCVSSVQPVCVSLGERWMWARGLRGENEWAHPSEVQRFKSFHSPVLQFYLWKPTRNVLSCLPHLAERASEADTLPRSRPSPFVFISLSVHHPPPPHIHHTSATLSLHWLSARVSSLQSAGSFASGANSTFTSLFLFFIANVFRILDHFVGVSNSRG